MLTLPRSEGCDDSILPPGGSIILTGANHAVLGLGCHSLMPPGVNFAVVIFEIIGLSLGFE